jgi:hypothetical protein
MTPKDFVALTVTDLKTLGVSPPFLIIFRFVCDTAHTIHLLLAPKTRTGKTRKIDWNQRTIPDSPLVASRELSFNNFTDA